MNPATVKSSACVVAYIRVSTDEQALGADAQMRALDDWRKGNAIRRFDEIYQDIGVSGAMPFEARPEGSRLLEYVAVQKPDFVIAAKRDRFARDVVVITMLERFLAHSNTRLLTADYSESIDDFETPEQRLLKSILDVFAQYERLLIKYRTKAAMAELKASGKKFGRPARWKGERLEFVRNRVLELRREGLSLRRIMRVVNLELPEHEYVHYTNVQQWVKNYDGNQGYDKTSGSDECVSEPAKTEER